jgi:hypothetical protein
LPLPRRTIKMHGPLGGVFGKAGECSASGRERYVLLTLIKDSAAKILAKLPVHSYNSPEIVNVRE